MNLRTIKIVKMTFKFNLIINSIIYTFIIITTVNSFAQNGNLFKEEEIKDQERDQLIKDLEEERKVEEQSIFNELTDQELDERNLVEVETNNILPADFTSVAMLVPYKVRRKKWGSLYSISYIMYNPINYDSKYGNYFDQVYGEDQGMIELSYDYKYNFTLGALSAQGGLGFLSADASDGSGSSITLTQYRVGLKYTLDNLFYEPTIAPYVGGGAYIMQFKESLAGDSANGNTSPAFYFHFGSYFQLDWLDRLASTESYAEAGIENTFLYLEARTYMSSESSGTETGHVADFSTELSLSGGFALEF